VDRHESQFPQLAALDCNAGHCEPSFAQTHYETNIKAFETRAKDNCILKINQSLSALCLPVLCRPSLLPENVAQFEYDGAKYSVDAIIPTMTSGRQFLIM